MKEERVASARYPNYCSFPLASVAGPVAAVAADVDSSFSHTDQR